VLLGWAVVVIPIVVAIIIALIGPKEEVVETPTI